MNGQPVAALAHLTVLPILLPLLTAAVMLLLGEQRRQAKAVLNVASCGLGLAVAVVLLARSAGGDAAAAFAVYLPSNWPVPFGIVLVLDRVAALLLLLSAGVGLASALFATARWQRAGVHFHPLFQVQLMGLNGAFLTGDLFNLFVFFEVMLVASYGLLLHGSGRPRVQAGLHYVAFNLLASSLFLIGVALLYGVVGTLNMADMAVKVAAIGAADRGLLHAGAALLGLAFLGKAAMWPLGFWLVPAYAAAAAPVAALFALMTKVGVYAVLRLWTLLFAAGDAAAGAAPFGATVLVWGGLATLAFGATGVLASQQLGRLAGFSLVASAGSLLAAIGLGQPAVTGGALYYLLASTLAASALFLLVELIERSRQVTGEVALPEVVAEKAPFVLEQPAAPQVPAEGVNLDDLERALIGRAIPAALAFLGFAFVACALLVAGLPPLPGFIAKLAIVDALLRGGADAAAPGPAAWTLMALLIGSGLTASVALARAGIRTFWAPQDRPLPRLRVIECLPIGALLLASVALVVAAEPALRFATQAAEALHRPAGYIDSVLGTRPQPPPAAAAPGR